jgi:rSAM/selenodomain-associated transferase 1
MSMHVTVIAKSPQPGRVKTRLCPPCTEAQAAELAAAALGDTLDSVLWATAGRHVRRVLLLDGPTPPWLPGEFEVMPQGSGDLGERMADGFDVLGPGLVVGMETPHAVADLDVALAALATGEDVIGPAVDGGYWAIGLGRVDRRAFAGVAWSTAHTLSDQVRALGALGRRVTLLHEARDIDTFDDVVALAASAGWGRAVQCARGLVDSIGNHMAGVAPCR